MYLYELHCHNRVSSACGQWSPEEMAEFYARQGYTGIVVTDHFMNGNSAVDRSLPWEEQVEMFCSGYERTKAAGARLGLDVFFAFEYSANSYYGQPWSPNRNKDSLIGTDFLIFGLGKDWLLRKDESILAMPVNAFLKMVREEGGTVVQAHPFRLETAYMDHISLFPYFTDGVEVLNGNPNTRGKGNRLAQAYAREYGFFATAGTDSHAPCEHLAATILPERASSVEALMEQLRAGRGELRMIESRSIQEKRNLYADQ